LRRRFLFSCGYCGVREQDVGAELTIDHFQPRSKNGQDETDNYVYCCHACNEFKGAYWQPDSSDRILHPHRDDLALHLIEDDDGSLKALTATGAFHIARLHLNRAALVEFRLERRRQELLRNAADLQHQQLEKLLEQLRTMIGKLRDFQTGAES